MTPRPLHADITEFVEILHRLMRMRTRLKAVLPQDEEALKLRARFMETHPDGKSGSQADFELLYKVGAVLTQQGQPMTMGELGQALDIPLSSATRIVDWLVKNDFAERLSDPADRRVVRVALKPSGVAMYKTATEFMRRRVEHVLSVFDGDERQTLIVLMTKLVTALEHEARPEPAHS
jgi:DNA-binding MarR family transcriptional regulator